MHVNKPHINRIRTLAFTLIAAVGLLSIESSAYAQSSDANNYRITANDLIGVKVFQELDLDTQARVDADGTISMPLVGSVLMKGQTVDQAAAQITRLLMDGYLVSPQVTVNVISYSKKTFTVLGQVTQPGTFDIPDNQTITLLDAVGMAGGFTRIANQRKVTLKRRTGGSVKVMEIDAKKLAVSNGSHGVIIHAGDIIKIEESLF
jgi:protein involved in polysaccharide export with SLBB domain